MKQLTTFAILAILLFITAGCKTTQNAPAQSPVAQDAVAATDNQQNQDSSEIDEPQNQSEEDAPENWRLLMEAAAKGDLASVKQLIASKADVNTQLENGWTPLKVATYEMHPAIVEAMLVAGADVNAQNGESKVSALMIAANGGRFRRGLGFPAPSMQVNTVVKNLIAANADVNAADSEGDTVLHYAVQKGDPEIVKILISAGADIHAVTSSQMTALMMATSCESPFCMDLETKVQLVQVLLQANAAVNAQDALGNTALHYAALVESNSDDFSGQAAYIVKMLLDAGADPKLKNHEGESPEAFVAGLKVKTLPKNNAIDSQSASLMRALLYRDFETAGELLKEGVDVNAKNSFGETLLMKAIVSSFWYGDLNNEGLIFAESLIAAGANVNAADVNGTTALMLASERMIPNLVEELLKAGADANAKDSEGRTALDRFGKKTRFFESRDVFFKDGTIALTRIDIQKIRDMIQNAM